VVYYFDIYVGGKCTWDIIALKIAPFE